MADGDVEIGVSLNPDQALSEADSVGNRIGGKVSEAAENAAGEATSSMRDSVKAVGKEMESFGAFYSKAVTLPIAAAAVAAGAAAVEIDTSLTGVRKTVDGTEEDYQRLKDAAIEFSKTNAVSASQILDIQALGAQLGYDIDQLQQFGEVVSGLDIATNMDAETAATELAQFSNIMGMAKTDTDRYGSTIVELGNNFATTEADISHMAQRIAGAGKQIGLSEADVLGLSTALSSMGIEAEAGGTAISTIMSNIDKEVATNGKNLELWAETAGMSVEQFSQAWGNNAVDALSKVLVGMDSATQAGGNMSVMLDELGITSIRQLDTFKRLASNSEFLGEAVSKANQAWEENTALGTEVENFNSSMAGRLEQLKNKAAALAEELGTPLMGAVLGIIDAAQPLIDLLADGAEAFGDMDKAQQQTVLTAVALVAGFGPAVGIIGKLITTVAKGQEGWRTFRSNLNAVRDGIMKSASAASRANTFVPQYIRTIGNGSAEFMKWDKATGKYVQTNNRLRASLMTSTAGFKAQEVAAKASGVAMKTCSKASKLLRETLKEVVAPIAVIMAVMSIADSFRQASEDADTLTDATDGLRDSLHSVGDAGSGIDEVAEDYEKSASDIISSSRDAIKAQADMAESFRDSFSEVQGNSALVDSYAETIERLAGQSGLTAEQQGELTAAVNGLNSVCGTTYEVIDAVNGQLSASTSEILANADAWEKNAKAQAYQEAYTEAVKNRIKMEEELAAATEAADNAARDYEITIGDVRVVEGFATAEANELADNRDRVAEATEAARDTEERLLYMYNQSTVVAQESAEAAQASAEATEANAEAMGAVADASSLMLEITDEMVEAVEKAAADSDGLAAAMSDVGFTAEEMAKALELTGNSADELADSIESVQDKTANAFEEIEQATDISLDKMQKNLEKNAATTSKWSDNVKSLYAKAGSSIETDFIAYLASLGPEYSSVLDELNNSSPQKLEQLANAWAKSLDAGRDGAVTAAQLTSSEVVNAIELGRAQAEEASKGMSDGVTDGIESGAGSAQAAAENVSSETATALGSADATSAGSNLVQGMINGMNAQSGPLYSAARSLAKGTVDAMKSELDIHSPSKKAEKEIGKNFAIGVANGIRKNKDYAKKSASELSELIVSKAKSRLSDQKRINDVSLKQEAAYWKEIVKQTKKGSKARYEATIEYKAVQKQIREERKKDQQARKKDQQTLKKAMAKYKETVRDIAKELAEDVKKVETELANDIADVQSNLAKDIADAWDGYYSAVQSRADSILSSFSMFDRFRVKSQRDADVLIENMQSQTEAAEEYRTEMEKLKKRIGDGDLFNEIAEQGVDALGQIRTLNNMSEEQIAEYMELYTRRNQAALKEAESENKQLLADTKATVQQLTIEANAEIANLRKEANAEIKDLTQQAASDAKQAAIDLADTAKGLSTKMAGAVANMADSISKSSKTAIDQIEKQIKALDKLAKKYNTTTGAKKTSSTNKTSGTKKTSSTKTATTRVMAAPMSLAEPAAVVYSDTGSAVGTARTMSMSYMGQFEQSIAKGVAAATIAATSGSTTRNVTNNQTVTFNQPVSTPDEVARTMRMQQRYGLAGEY